MSRLRIHRCLVPCFVFVLLCTALQVAVNLAAAPVETDSTDEKVAEEPVVDRPKSVGDARQRTRLLHEAFHATLQIVHRRYYREDEGLKIPSSTLDEVFAALAPRCNVELRWIAVNAPPMNVDHAPQDEFEKQAIAALAAGKVEFELFENGVYRHAGPIVLSSECLKCHVPNRTSTEDRLAGLVIAMPVDEK